VGALRRIRVAWGEVVKLDYNAANRWFFLTARGGRRIYVAEALEGIADFAELALRQLPPPTLAASPDAAEALRDLAAP
jgi:hypothetical protein